MKCVNGMATNTDAVLTVFRVLKMWQLFGQTLVSDWKNFNQGLTQANMALCLSIIDTIHISLKKTSQTNFIGGFAEVSLTLLSASLRTRSEGPGRLHGYHDVGDQIRGPGLMGTVMLETRSEALASWVPWCWRPDTSPGRLHGYRDVGDQIRGPGLMGTMMLETRSEALAGFMGTWCWRGVELPGCVLLENN